VDNDVGLGLVFFEGCLGLSDFERLCEFVAKLESGINESNLRSITHDRPQLLPNRSRIIYTDKSKLIRWTGI
jgi:hypothetical protein